MNKAQVIKHYNTLYCYLYRNNRQLLEKYFGNIQNRRKKGSLDLRFCKEDAMKYSSRVQWQVNSGSIYSAAAKNGWLDECCIHMKALVKRNYWTKERVINSAKQYTTIKEWSIKDAKAYDASKRHGWYKECTKYLENLKHKSKKVICLDTKVIYKCANTASDKTKINCSNIRSACNGNAKTAGGYRWAYCDEEGNVIDD